MGSIFSKRFFLVLLILPIVVGIAWVYWRYQLQPISSLTSSQGTSTIKNTKTGTCLGVGEAVSYEIENNPQGGGLVIVILKNRITNNEIRTLKVPILDTEHAHAIEFHGCGIYVVRKFNYDYKKRIYLPGYSAELWKYDYLGNGNRLIVLGNKELNGKENAFFQFDFHVNLSEEYISLTRGYSGSADYAIVVKDLATLSDVLVITQKELVSKYGIPQYEIGPGNWLDDNTFLAFVTDGAVSYDEIIVHRGEDNNWKLTVLPVPDDASMVTAWNPDGYWIAYNNGPGWIGAEEIEQDVYKQWRAEGKTQSLFVYNLGTKQKITLISDVDPAWIFKTIWISTTTLQYTLPSGATSTYTLPK